MQLPGNVANDSIYRPVIPVTLALVTGIVLGDRFPGAVSVLICVAAMAALGTVVGARRQQKVFWTPMLLSLAVGYLCILPWTLPTRSSDHIVHYLNSGRWRVSATVMDSPTVRFDRTQVIVRVNHLTRNTTSHTVQGRLRLTIMGNVGLSPGDRIVFPAALRSFRNFRNPGGFDYRRYMHFKGIHGSAWVKAENLHHLGNKLPPGRRHLTDIRRRIVGIIDDAAGTAGEASAILKALVLGDRSGITPDLRERFNRSGTGHLLAISGLHVGIVAAAAFWILRWMFSFIPFLLWRGWGRQWAAALTLAPVLAYGILAGMSPSTQRAVLMVTVFLTAVMVGRHQDTLNTVAVAALIILIVFPPALFSISFQLSFSAVLTIVYGLAKMPKRSSSTVSGKPRERRWLIDFILVSALAIVGTAPLVALYFNQTSLVGIAANLLLVPLVGFLAVPTGLVATVISIVGEPLAGPGFWMAIQVVQFSLVVVDFFAALPYAAVNVVTPSPFEVGCYYLALGAVLNLGQHRVVKWLLAAVLVAVVGDVGFWAHQRFWHRDLKATAIDVGQGTSMLMELPGGSVLLYDGGGFSDNRRFDIGRQVLAPLLWRRKIATVDVLVLSHPNADHLNGLIYIARHFNVRELWTNGDVNTTQGYKALMAACRERQVKVRTVHAGCAPTTIGPVELTIMHPDEHFAPPASPPGQMARNNASVVLKAIYGETSFLFTGDIMARGEQTLVTRFGDALSSTVMVAPHHGSRSSSSQGLVNAVRPAVVVISAGAGNRFGFPHDEVVRRYQAAGSQLLCTGSHGAVSMRSDGRQIHVRSVVDANI